MKEEKRTPIQTLFVNAPESLLLGGITGLGYFSSYLSDLGYKSHFQMPSMFVEISLNSVILSVCIIVATLLIAVLSVVVPGFRRYGKIIFPLLIPLALAVIIGLKLNFSFDWINLWKIVFLLLFHAGLLWCFFHFAERKDRTSATVSISLLIVLIVSISYSSGTAIAENQKYFMVSSGPKPLVVVDTYKDSLIVAPLNPDRRTIVPEYRFIHLESAENERLRFEMRNIGPLKIERTRSH